MIIEKLTYSNYKKAIGIELWKERQKRSISLRRLEKELDIQMKQIDKLELGKATPPSSLTRILQYYGKKIRVELVD